MDPVCSALCILCSLISCSHALCSALCSCSVPLLALSTLLRATCSVSERRALLCPDQPQLTKSFDLSAHSGLCLCKLCSASRFANFASQSMSDFAFAFGFLCDTSLPLHSLRPACRHHSAVGFCPSRLSQPVASICFAVSAGALPVPAFARCRSVAYRYETVSQRYNKRGICGRSVGRRRACAVTVIAHFPARGEWTSYVHARAPALVPVCVCASVWCVCGRLCVLCVCPAQ